jgi:hypothetical protein
MTEKAALPIMSGSAAFIFLHKRIDLFRYPGLSKGKRVAMGLAFVNPILSITNAAVH